MIHNGKEVRDAEGKLIGRIYGIVEDAPINEPEAPVEPPKKTTVRKSSTKKKEA